MNAPVELAFVGAAARGELGLPSVPRVVRRLIAGLQQGDMHVQGIIAELEQEPQLAAHTLRLANSAQYGARRTLSSLADAVVTIGTEPLRTLVIGCGLQSMFVEVPGVNLRRFWTDATVAAQVARSLARKAGHNSEAAFLQGLLHGVGHLILCRAFPMPMQQALHSARTYRGATLAELELLACGHAHPAIGAMWLQALDFPPDICTAVAHQLDVAQAPVLYAALQVAAAAESGDTPQAVLQGLPAELNNVFAAPDWKEQLAQELPQILGSAK